MEEAQQSGSSQVPQKKRKLEEHTNQRYVKSKAPYKAGRKPKTSFSRDVGQKRFKCECCYCQRDTGETSGISTERKATFHSSSLDKVTQELNTLMLNTDTIQLPLLQEMFQEREEESKTEAAKKPKGCYRGS